jgi:hypothetical protein
VLQAEKQTEVQIPIIQTDLILIEFPVLITEEQQTEITQKTELQQTEVTILKELTQAEIIRRHQIILQELITIHKELNQEDIQAKTDLIIQTELLQLLNKRSPQEVILKTDQIQADQPLRLNRHNQPEAILKAADQVLIIIHQEHKVLKALSVLNLQEQVRNQEAANRKEKADQTHHPEVAEEEVNEFLFLNK